MTSSFSKSNSVSENSINFAEEVLNAHNMFRKRHGVTPLELNAHLSKQCQKCAQQVLHSTTVESSNYPIVGENIYVIAISDPEYFPKGEDPVTAWYNQRQEMELKQGPVNQKCINYSQVVWKATQILGVGVARSENKIVIVCHYLPPGNICGEYWRNVLPEVAEKKRPSYAEVASSTKK